jgi:hypothetical protein
MKNTFAKGLALSLLSAAVFAAHANAGCTREQGQQYCTSDAMRLCSQFIPDETKIAACLKQNLKNLSPNCKKCFSSFEEEMGWAR